jgi:hypothetical protein
MAASQDLESLYGRLSELKSRVGGFRNLRDTSGRSGWPGRGVYFFFDEQEPRGSGNGLRIVRVGTHALRLGSRTTLWGRLHNHKGNEGGRHPGGGNHRGSVFRFHVGAAMLTRSAESPALLRSWMDRGAPGSEHAAAEHEVEHRVSRYIRDLPLLWVGVPDEPGPSSHRGLLETNSIALLSTEGRAVDPPRRDWLGHSAPSGAISRSGLWNVGHVGEGYDPSFLGQLEEYIREM